MHNIKEIRKDFSVFAQSLERRSVNIDFKNLQKLDEQNRELIQQKESLEKEKKDISKSKDEAMFKRSKEISSDLEKISDKQKKVKIELDNILSNIPNIPHPDVPNGKDENDNIVGLRETNTMPQWAGSCWYYLRFTDPSNYDVSWAKDKEKYWMPVDLYIGGQEHAVLHLLYARFWHHVLHDLGLVSTKEPFKKLYNQGMILGDDGTKMSKSRGNVVNPDDIINEYGADSMRLYEMFMGPLNKSKPWNTKGLQGCYRFINKLWGIIVDEEGNLSSKITEDVTPDKETLHIHHTTVKKVGDDIEHLHFNTAVSQLMIYCNHLQKCEKISKNLIVDLVKIAAPFMPQLKEEKSR